MAAMAEDLDDEDVIYENSALLEHLKDIGYTDFEVVSRKCKNDFKVTSHSESTLSWLMGKLHKMVSNVNIIYHKCMSSRLKSLQQVDLAFLPKYTKDIIKSKLLESEDQLILEDYIQERPTLRSSFKVNSASLSFGRFAAVWVASMSYVAGKFYVTTSIRDTLNYFTKLDVCLIAASLLILSKESRKIWLHWHRIQIHKENIRLLQQFLHDNEALTKIVKKSIRLIQETEVISRGFTLVTGMTPVARLELSSLQQVQRQCSLLRQSLYNVARTVFFLFRNISLEHIKNSLHQDTSYLFADISLEGFGPCMILPKDSDELKQATDDYSLTSIKAINQVAIVQRSEYLRILAKNLLSTLDNPALQQTEPNDVLLNFAQVFKATNDSIAVLHHQLQLCYDSQKFSLWNRPNKKLKRLNNQQETTPFHSTHIAVHSLSLHLQAALNRVQSLENEVEAEPPSNFEENKTNLLNNFLLQLNQIQLDLENCRGCWEEAVMSIDKQTNRIKEMPDSKFDLPIFKSVEMPSSKPIPLFEIGDSVIGDSFIEDEVFEVYTDPYEICVEDGFHDYSTPEEGGKKRQEREESLRLLKELKSVLTIKASARAACEKRAVATAESDLIVKVTDSLGINTLTDTTIVKTDETGQEENAPSPCQLYSDEHQPVDPLTLNSRQPGLVTEAVRSPSPTALPITTLQHENKSDNSCSIYPNLLDKDSNYAQAGYSDGQLVDNCRLALTNHKPPSYKQQRFSQIDGEDDAASDSLVELQDDNSEEDLFPDRQTMTSKLQRLTQTNLSFTADVAAMAVACSNQLKLTSETFQSSGECFSESSESDVELSD